MTILSILSIWVFTTTVLLTSKTLGEVEYRPHGYGYIEEEISAALPLIEDITEERLRHMALDDPILRACFYRLAGELRAVSSRQFPDPVIESIFHDLQRRGDAATPLLLDIMDRNHNLSVETDIPQLLLYLGGFELEPYTEYLRTMIATRPDEMSDEAASLTAGYFARHGKRSDIELMRSLVERRPILAEGVTSTLWRYAKWAAGQGIAVSPTVAELALAYAPVPEGIEIAAASRKAGEEPSESDDRPAKLSPRSPVEISSVRDKDAPANAGSLVALSLVIAGACGAVWVLSRKCKSPKGSG